MILAGGAIRRVPLEGCHTREKLDRTPVTEADMASHRAIVQWLAHQDPGVLLVSEESEPGSICSMQDQGDFWIADPLDGTTEFLAGEADYGVCLARISHGIPIAGAILLPATGELFWGVSGVGAFQVDLLPDEWEGLSVSGVSSLAERIQVRATALVCRELGVEDLQGPLRILCSRRHGDVQTEAHVASFPEAQRLVVGACVKFLRLVQGRADYYPRLASLHEWDIAAGHAILRAAGGSMLVYGSTEEVQYGNQDFVAPWFQALG